MVTLPPVSAGNMTLRPNVQADIETDLFDPLLKNLSQQSYVLRAARTVPVAKGMTEFPIYQRTASAGFVTQNLEDGSGFKPTSPIGFTSKSMPIAEAATIISVHEDDLEDVKFDITSYITTAGASAIAALVDSAVMFGEQYPSIWKDKCLYDTAVSYGNVVNNDTDLYGDLISTVKSFDETFTPNTLFAHRYTALDICNMRNEIGTPIYYPWQNLSNASLVPPEGNGQVFGMNSWWIDTSRMDNQGNRVRIWDPKKCKAMLFDGQRVLIGIREDITVKYLTEATIDGINLAQTDRVAFRFKFRFGYALDDVVTGYNQNASPVAVLAPGAADTKKPSPNIVTKKTDS